LQIDRDENIEKFGGDFLENIVVGEIKEIAKHPNADKLQVTKVDIGTETLQIFVVPQTLLLVKKFLWLLLAQKLPMGEIKKRRFEILNRLACFARQMKSVSGPIIQELCFWIPNCLCKALSEIYGDWILEGKVLANRGDLQNHMQLAREIAAIYGKDFKSSVETQGFSSINNNSPIDIKIENFEACPLYIAQAIKNIKIAPSPVWIQQKLLACGMKPINNVVDITNFVMLEYGNPLHAFDAKKNSGH